MSERKAPSIWVPKLKTYEAELSAPVAEVEGFFLLEACNRYGRPRRSLRWKQVITDLAMNNVWNPAQNTLHSYAGVGLGTTPFLPSDTSLNNQIGGRTSSSVSDLSVYDTAGNDGYRQTFARTLQFPLGAVVANLTEVGMFSGATGNNAQFLDLIRDSDGNPTTFPVTSEDQLRITHVLYLYPFLGVTDGSFVVGGPDGSGSHDYESSMCSLLGTGSTLGTFGGPNFRYAAYRGVSGIGSVTEQTFPNALFIGDVTNAHNASVTNDGTIWTQSHTMTAGLTNFNHAEGISGIRPTIGTSTSGRSYKFFIDPPIPKFAGSVQRILTLTFRSGIKRG